jgi:DNA-binding CsgD family transcriptional regulator
MGRVALQNSTTEHENEQKKQVLERGGPGIMVLGLPMRILHMNQRASDLIAKFPWETHVNGHPRGARGVLPTPFLEVCSEIERLLSARTQRKDWERFEVKRLLGGQERELLIRGFGVPDGRGTPHARIILTFEEIVDAWNVAGGHRTTEEFRLTQREQGVFNGIAKGWTNKEIANFLGISVHTVREHIHHIMDKTHSRTRTGVLAKFFRSDRA